VWRNYIPDSYILKVFYHIFLVYRHNGDVRDMAQILEVLLNSGVLIPAIWLSLGFVTAWILLSAKRVVPLTHEEAETLWKVHKQKTLCRARGWQEIVRKNKIIGFECECGHKHVQKKHIITINA
jgi:hypothetical protein